MNLFNSFGPDVFNYLRTNESNAGYARAVWRRLRVVWLIGAIGISGCGSERVLSARFEQDRINDPPNIDQEIGRCRTNLFGTVRVVRFANSNMVRLTQDAQAGSPSTALRCAFLATHGAGRYLFTMRVFIPKGSAAAILFQDAGVNANDFFRVDLPITGLLQAPGSTVTSGFFPHDQMFSVSVNLHIGAPSSVEVTLLGKAHGSFTAEIPNSAEFVAQNFSAVQLAIGTHDQGMSFVADDLSVIFNQ